MYTRTPSSDDTMKLYRPGAIACVEVNRTEKKLEQSADVPVSVIGGLVGVQLVIGTGPLTLGAPAPQLKLMAATPLIGTAEPLRLVLLKNVADQFVPKSACATGPGTSVRTSVSASS